MLSISGPTVFSVQGLSEQLGPSWVYSTSIIGSGQVSFYCCAMSDTLSVCRISSVPKLSVRRREENVKCEVKRREE